MYGTNTSGETRTDVITAVRGEQINLGVNLFTPSGVVTSYVWDPAAERRTREPSIRLPVLTPLLVRIHLS